MRIVYSPLDALRDRPREPRPRGGVLRDRLRDDRAVHRADAQARAKAEGIAQLLLPVQPRHDRAAAARAAGLARPAARRLHRPRPRLDAWSAREPFQFIPADYGRPLVISGLRAAGRPAVDPDAARASSPTAAARSRTSTARVVSWEGNPRALEVMAEVFELRAHFEWRGLGFISQSALKICRRLRRARRRAPLRGPGRARGRPARRASAARCSRARSSRGSARCSARRARPSARSARAWSRPRAPARPTTATAAIARERRGACERR